MRTFLKTGFKASLHIGLALSLLFPTAASANTGKEFTTSVIYGTLAGALVGAATLAFTSNPGGNLNNVARGASYGLYAGILLGLYVTYGMNDSQQSDTETIRPDPGVYEGTPPPTPDNTAPGSSNPPQSRLEKKSPVHLALYPVVETQPLTRTQGWGVACQILDFHF